MCVFASVAIDFLGMAIVYPTLPAYVLALGGTKADFGYLLSAYSVASVLSGFFMPWFADRYGCRKGFLLSLSGSGLGALAQGFATSFAELLAFRFAAGLFSGSAGMAMAYIATVTTPAERPKYFPYVGTIIMTSFALGPGFGAGLSSLTDDPQLKAQLPMFCASGLAACALWVSYTKLVDPETLRPEPLRKESTVAKGDGEVEVLAASAPKGRAASLMLMALCSFLKSANYNVFPSCYGYFIQEEFGKGSAFFAFAFTASGIVVIVNNTLVFAWLRSRLDVFSIGLLGGVVCAAATLFVPHMPTYGWSLAALAAMIAGNGLIENVIPLVLAEYATGKSTARILAISSQAAWAGHIGGPIIYANLKESSGGYALPFLLAAALALLSGVLFVYVRVVSGHAKPKGASGGKESKGKAGEAGVSMTTDVGNPAAETTELTVAGKAKVADVGGGGGGGGGVPDDLLEQLKADLAEQLVARNYASAFDAALHSASDIDAARDMVRELVSQALPALPAGEGPDHIKAWDSAQARASAGHDDHHGGLRFRFLH
jgi:MFS transporter, DHA1 family, multidrug resistance protein